MLISEFIDGCLDKQWKVEMECLDRGIINSVTPVNLTEEELCDDELSSLSRLGHSNLNNENNPKCWYFDFGHSYWANKEIDDSGSISPKVIMAIERYYLERFIDKLD